MAHGYETRGHPWLGKNVRVLARSSEEEDFLERMERDRKRNERFKLIRLAIKKICERGIGRCVGKRNFVKPLDSCLGLCEVRVAGHVIRVMTYLHSWKCGQGLVLLFDFDGHQGSDRISRSQMDKGRRLAKEARACIEREKRWQ